MFSVFLTGMLEKRNKKNKDNIVERKGLFSVNFSELIVMVFIAILLKSCRFEMRTFFIIRE